MGRKPAAVSEAELEILKVLWEHGPASVREVLERLQGRKRAYTTVLTLLQRLAAKGCAAFDVREGVNVYRAAVSRDEMIRSRLGEVADDLCDGTRSPLMHALMSGGRFTAEDVAHFRELLAKLESEAEQKKKR